MDYEDALIDIRDNSPSPSLSTVGVQEASRVPTPVPPPPTPPPRHPFYYIDDDMAIICVEEQLFKVHKYFLIRESELFQGMFGLPPGDSMTAEGRDDHHPIVLKQVLAREFESLLRFLYHGMFDDCGVTLPQWIDILSISTFWACDKLRARAIKEIHDHRPRIDPVEKVVLAVKYFVPEWLAPSYAAVCQRALPINSVEGHKLGLEKTILLARAREAVRQDHVAREQRHAQGAGGRGNVRQNLNSRTTASPAPPEPEPLPSTASCWGEWKGLTVPPPEDPFDAERVAEIVHEVFQAPEEAGAN
ncbi:uncharacterized protein C8Q71DRAFT_123993 [Rhodofomes roseus]|nr:uncharacterized protein C8Q71DRAFT_123993 [Rhodofomes roseus]KAH9834779.1 hypothetical protein C8Q71DRAFT_123993 [Rhodofomes roseus]